MNKTMLDPSEAGEGRQPAGKDLVQTCITVGAAVFAVSYMAFKYSNPELDLPGGLVGGAVVAAVGGGVGAVIGIGIKNLS